MVVEISRLKADKQSLKTKSWYKNDEATYDEDQKSKITRFYETKLESLVRTYNHYQCYDASPFIDEYYPHYLLTNAIQIDKHDTIQNFMNPFMNAGLSIRVKEEDDLHSETQSLMATDAIMPNHVDKDHKTDIWMSIHRRSSYIRYRRETEFLNEETRAINYNKLIKVLRTLNNDIADIRNDFTEVIDSDQEEMKRIESNIIHEVKGKIENEISDLSDRNLLSGDAPENPVTLYIIIILQSIAIIVLSFINCRSTLTSNENNTNANIQLI